MPTTDLFTADFPHGSPAGFDRGCRGSECPNRGDPTFFTCREAKNAKRADWTRRNHPDGAPMTRDPDTAPTTLGAAPTPEIPLEKHGTTAGYAAGCRLKTHCPGIASVGRSCNDAVAAYQREIKANRTARAAAATGPKPAPPTEPLHVDPISEDAVAALDTEQPDNSVPVAELTPTVDAGNELDDRDELRDTLATTRTLLDSEREAHALTRKRLDDALTGPNPQSVSDLEQRLAHAQDALAHERHALAETQELLLTTQRALARTAPDHLEQAAAPAVIPVRTGGDTPTRVTIGDVHLDLPPEAVASLRVEQSVVHVQIGR